MPYGIRKTGSGYKVVNKQTGKTYAKHPQSKATAAAQMRLLYAKEKDHGYSHVEKDVNDGTRRSHKTPRRVL